MNQNLTVGDTDHASTPLGMPRFSGIWNGRREIRNWWWVLPVAALVHAQFRTGVDQSNIIGNLPIRLKLRSGQQIFCRANEIFQIVEVFISGDYENPDISYGEAHTVLDVGANIGVSTIWFSQHCPMARIFAIEPSLETSSRLLRNIKRNRLGNRVTALTLAIGEGGRPLYLVTGEHSGLSHTASDPRQGSEIVWSTDLRTILEIVGGHVDVMKLDCEGAEYQIILGADDHSLSQIDNIVGEYHGSDLEARSRLFSRLEEAGFTVSHQSPSQPPTEVGIFSAVRVGA